LERLTVKEYARRNRMSVYEVIRKLRRGELSGETVEEKDGRVHYVHVKENDNADEEKMSCPDRETVPEDMAQIVAELASLRREIARLKEVVARCCEKEYSAGQAD